MGARPRPAGRRDRRARSAEVEALEPLVEEAREGQPTAPSATPTSCSTIPWMWERRSQPARRRLTRGVAADEGLLPGPEAPGDGGSVGAVALAGTVGPQAERHRRVQSAAGPLAQYRASPPAAGPARHSSQVPIRPACRTGRPGRSSPRPRSDAGASTQARAVMLRSRVGVAGRSAVLTGVSSSGRSS